MWAGWGHLGTVGGAAVPEEVYVLRGRYAPHDWLFPRCAAVVHHGGAGRESPLAILSISSAVVGMLRSAQHSWTLMWEPCPCVTLCAIQEM